MTDTPNTAPLPPLAPDAPITRANLAQALLEVIASLPQDLGDPGSPPCLCVNGSSAGGALTYIPAAPKDVDHA